jgi:ubiquitin C-terminal hydrolase
VNISNPYFSHLQEVIDSLFFEVDATLQIINYKTQNFSSKIFSYKDPHSEIKKEIPLGSDFYSQQFIQNNNNNTSTRSNNKEKEKSLEERDNIIIITEISLHKLFELDINRGEGYTGIINEAATCYMNSMLQTLNVLGIFKKAVFQIPISEEEYNGKTNSVALSLQRLFYDLMKDTSPISTDRLVRSFGWGREQISIQHDVQEFNLLLSDVMEKKMKGTPGEGTFSKLFEGKLINYIKCVNVDYKSEKEEKFNDLQLTVKGCKNIYESLNVYTEEELLDNADKYEAEGYGKQTAKKGIKFSKFPPVLILQLKRFEYNPRKEAMVKINDYFEFYEEIDLSKYMQNDDEEEILNFKNNLKKTKNLEIEEDNSYTLHSVVVHQGNANSGHYFAFIRPTVNDIWVLFNDEVVRPADKYEVFNNNFGGSYNSYKHKSKGEIVTNVNYYESNAYILVYIKNSEREKILSPVLTKDINPYIISRFEAEKNEEKKIKAKKMRISDNMNIILFSRECIKMDENSDKLGIINSFCDMNHDAPLVFNKCLRMMINFPKNLSVIDFLTFISAQTNIDITQMSLYKYETDESAPENFLKNRGYFYLELITSEYYDKNLIDFTNGLKKKLLCFYLHVNDDKLKLFRKFDLARNNYKEEWKIQNLNSEVQLSDQGLSHGAGHYQSEKMVFVCKELNNLAFYKNENLHSQSYVQLDSKKSSSQNSYPDLQNSENEILIFIKELKNMYTNSDSNNKNNLKLDSTPQLKITKIFKINKNNFNNFYDLENYLSEHILNEIENSLREKKFKIYFLIEKREGYKTANMTLTENNYLFNFTNTNSLVLIPYLEAPELKGCDIYPNYDLVLTKIDSLYNTVYLDIFSQDLQSYIIQKLKIDNINIHEDGMRDLICNTIKEKRLYKNLIDLNNHYLLDQNKSLNLLTEIFLSNFISLENFDIPSERDKGPKFTQACKEIQILKFLNFSECRIDFNFSIYPKENLNDSYLQHLTIYDIDNNKICQLSIIFPKKIKKCKEMLEYIYNTVLTNKNIVREIFDYDQYFFILQNPKKNYIYQMLVDNNSELSKFEGKAENLEFRLQPFSLNEIDNFFDSNHYKIFVSFNEKFKLEAEGENSNTNTLLFSGVFNKVVLSPLVLFIKKNLTLFELKFTINERIKKMISSEMGSEKIQINNHQLISDFFEYLNISYFTSKIKDNKVHKEVNLQHYKEEEVIENILKEGRVYNILVEISTINSRIKME